ncbi:G-patch domain-containing protein [Plasmodiophora brassicae]|uniref:G-patch domain-containing protein n=1 Tax=Plasmodiophora brassicae TaxID=37360 RepID=A0A0G4J3W8_PLABS|nr:hypothetical protein PBRA_002452 [Plasmodiophora brassicae]
MYGLDEKDEEEEATDERCQSTDHEFCTWVQNTNGIGLALMMKSGYRFGTGLGKRRQGRINPVPINVRPPGAGIAYQPSTAPRKQRPSKVEPPVEAPPDVFDFINVSVNRRRTASDAPKGVTTLSEQECTTSLLAMSGRAEAARDECERVRSAMKRSAGQGNGNMASHYQSRLQAAEANLARVTERQASLSSARKRHKSASMKSFKF